MLSVSTTENFAHQLTSWLIDRRGTDVMLQIAVGDTILVQSYGALESTNPNPVLETQGFVPNGDGGVVVIKGETIYAKVGTSEVSFAVDRITNVATVFAATGDAITVEADTHVVHLMDRAHVVNGGMQFRD